MNMRPSGRLSYVTLLTALLTVSHARAEDSAWSAGVGKILPSDDTVWCKPDVSAPSGIFTAKAKLQLRDTSGALTTDNYTDGGATTLRLNMQCYNVNTSVFSAPISSASFANNATLTCPANNVGVNVRCMLRSTDTSPFTYGGGNMGGDPCGNGINEIKPPGGYSGYKGQVTGFSSELNFRAKTNNAMFNTALMKTAQVHGTDMGFFFYSGGQLWSGYGDTWANGGMISVWPTLQRGSVLFSTNDLDASDGLSFSSFQGMGFPNFATEVVPCCHNDPKPPSTCDEISAIATAGFGLRENGVNYRVLWFNAIKSWFPFTTKVATLALSTNGGAFQRRDAVPGSLVPTWGDDSSFGAGAIYQDRLAGFLYFFGQRPYQSTPTPIRLARVEAKFASVTDRSKYQYWNGSEWKPSTAVFDASKLSSFGPAADIIPASAAPGPEFSVAFDAYANRYIMLFETKRWTNDTAVELWQSSYITGPWTKVTNGETRLPRATTTGGTWSPYNFFYGPYMSEQLMKKGGESIYYQMSEWNGVGGFRPYNTGLWTFDISRFTANGCVGP
jgi:hypothetical protein